MDPNRIDRMKPEDAEKALKDLEAVHAKNPAAKTLFGMMLAIKKMDDTSKDGTLNIAQQKAMATRALANAHNQLIALFKLAG